MRKVISLLLCLVMIFSITIPTFAAEKPIRIKLCNYTDTTDNWVGEKWIISKNDVKAFKKEHPNAKYIVSDTKAVIKNQRTMVPLRVIAEELGYTVEWGGGSVTLYRIVSNIQGSNNSGYKYYKNYNQFSKFINLFYRLEGGRVDRFDDISLSFDENYRTTSIGEMVNNGKLFIYTIDLSVGSEKGYVDFVSRSSLENYDDMVSAGVFYNIDSPAYIDKQNRTMIPLRAMGEMMGLSVSWDNANRVVTISA